MAGGKNINSGWSSGNLIFENEAASTSSQIAFGVDGIGIDIKFFGDTEGAYMLWDYSADTLVFAGGAKMGNGTSGVPLILTAATPIETHYFTYAGTSGSTSAEPVLFNTVMTGAGGVGGRVRVNLETNVVLGGWANAFKASVDCKTNGKATGLMSVINAELVLPGGTLTGLGTFGVYEAEIVCPASWAGNLPVSFFYLAASGATVTNFDTCGYLFDINGVTSGATSFWYTGTSSATGDNAIRIRVNGADKWLLVADDAS